MKIFAGFNDYHPYYQLSGAGGLYGGQEIYHLREAGCLSNSILDPLKDFSKQSA